MCLCVSASTSMCFCCSVKILREPQFVLLFVCLYVCSYFLCVLECPNRSVFRFSNDGVFVLMYDSERVSAYSLKVCVCFRAAATGVGTLCFL